MEERIGHCVVHVPSTATRALCFESTTMECASRFIVLVCRVACERERERVRTQCHISILISTRAHTSTNSLLYQTKRLTLAEPSSREPLVTLLKQFLVAQAFHQRKALKVLFNTLPTAISSIEQYLQKVWKIAYRERDPERERERERENHIECNRIDVSIG
jgi:hypothetical protein